VSAADAVSVSIEVEVGVDAVFDVFTRELDAWWGRGPQFRFLAPYAGALTLEPGVGGRLVHTAGAVPGRVFVVGHVRVWEPPHRLALTWRLPNFAPDQLTHVDVRFEAIAEGTRVTVTHSGWDAVAADHPARHGHVGREFVLWKGRWWAELLAAVRRHAEDHRSGRVHGGRPA
jgi:uncharacterized protein YndB with AHSA1/START domain